VAAPDGAQAVELVDHLFRRSAGQMVSTLTRIFGSRNLSLAEEVVQEALVRAIETWPHRGIPENPAGWLMQVARNRALDRLRRESRLHRKLAELGGLGELGEVRGSGPEPDDTLSMLLMGCHPLLPPETRVTLTLKTVGGFGVEEIARALLLRPATVAQRLVRAKRLIRERKISFALPARGLTSRLASALEVLYLLFNEGYAAHGGDNLVRAELCEEAIRLASLLAAHSATGRPEVHALLALFLLQASRLPARSDSAGALVLLADQDRGRWDRGMIAAGLRHLERCAQGKRRTSYHLEAGIAACHAVAASSAATDWAQILALYDELLAANPSPVVALNRAVALSMVAGPQAGLAAIAGIAELAGHAQLATYYLLPATRGDLWLKCGERERAASCYRQALALPCSEPERRFMFQRLEDCAPAPPGTD
jgi:RNA polymerase sigma-70 factor (ECF subfamily)